MRPVLRVAIPTVLLAFAAFWLGDGAGLAPSTEFLLAGLACLGGLVAALFTTRGIGRVLLVLVLAALTLVCAGAVILDMAGLE